MKFIFFIFLFMALFLREGAVYPADEERVYQGVQYACTGVGESKEDPNRCRRPVRMNWQFDLQPFDRIKIPFDIMGI